MTCRFCSNKGKHWHEKICPDCRAKGRRKENQIIGVNDSKEKQLEKVVEAVREAVKKRKK